MDTTYTETQIVEAADDAEENGSVVRRDDDSDEDECRCCCCTGECRQPYDDEGEEVVDLDLQEKEAAEAAEAAFLRGLEEQEYFAARD